MFPHALVVFSHLRWDFVYQRPQHLLARLAAHRKVLFIEEPFASEECSAPYWERSEREPNIIIYRPYWPKPDRKTITFTFTEDQYPVLEGMVRDVLAQEGVTDYAVWLYTPMALPLAKSLTPAPAAVIYDCMDELSAFRDAPQELLHREQELLEWADVVFTGGPSLYAAKKDRHPNVHCFPSSVDAAHFRQALTIAEAEDQASLPHPRLGFYGVIDERLDLGLVEAISAAHPEWQIVMVGPVVKIDEDSLPKSDNIHYFGQRAYAELPSYLAGWDVCLLPFALNESTQFISPTKTLEYMAAELPIVSTPITDVAEPYGEIVYIGATHQEFISKCEQALAAPEQERTARIEAMREVLKRTSWDSTVREMERLIGEAAEARSVTLQATGG
jgi:UDP-galactopyranose mutase